MCAAHSIVAGLQCETMREHKGTPLGTGEEWRGRYFLRTAPLTLKEDGKGRTKRFARKERGNGIYAMVTLQLFRKG